MEQPNDPNEFSRKPPQPPQPPVLSLLAVCDAICDRLDGLRNDMRRRFDAIEVALHRIERSLQQQGSSTMAVIDDILAEVQAESAGTDSAIALLNSLHQELQAALDAQDTTKMQAILDGLKANESKLAQAVVANPDPAAQPAPPTP